MSQKHSEESKDKITESCRDNGIKYMAILSNLILSVRGDTKDVAWLQETMSIKLEWHGPWDSGIETWSPLLLMQKCVCNLLLMVMFCNISSWDQIRIGKTLLHYRTRYTDISRLI